MTDTDRTTINIGKAEHRQTRDVKDEYGDSWTDVLRFYREHRSELSISDANGRAVDSDAVMAKLEQLEGAQADTVNDALELADISNHDVLEQLDEIEAAAKEATSAAHRAERAINEVTER